jgi:hypothetical protein
MKQSNLITILLVTLIYFAANMFSFACKPIYNSLEYSLRNSNFIIIGTVTKPFEIIEDDVYVYTDRKRKQTEFKINVEKILRLDCSRHCHDKEKCSVKKIKIRNEQNIKTVKIKQQTTMCDELFTPELNRRYVFFLYLKCKPKPSAGLMSYCGVKAIAIDKKCKGKYTRYGKYRNKKINVCKIIEESNNDPSTRTPLY